MSTAADTLDDDVNVPSYSYAEVVVAPILMMSLSLIAALLRCWVKRMMLNMFSIDDWLLILSFILYVALCTPAICAAGHGFGVHSSSLTKDDLVVLYHVGHLS
jgi:hypothetical protein